MKTPPQSMSEIFQVYSVVLGNGVRQVTQQWDAHFPDSSLRIWALRADTTSETSVAHLLPRRVGPGQMSEMRIDAARDHLCVDLPEFLDAIGESQDLRWANKGAKSGWV